MSTTKHPNIYALIDGFNLYHFINNKSFRRYKWLDVKSLCTKFIPPSATLTGITWFSALPHWNPDKVKRHELYIKALQSTGVSIQLGRFKKVTKNLQINERAWMNFHTHEEKQTDVCLGVTLVSLATTAGVDGVILVSGDTDYLPAIQMAKKIAPEKTIHVVVPGNLVPREIKSSVDRASCINEKHLMTSLLPSNISLRSGRDISSPIEWK